MSASVEGMFFALSRGLLEAAKVPLFLQTSLIPTEVSSRCHIFKEFRKKIARTLNHFNINVAHKPVMTVGSILKKNLKTNLVKTYRQE